MGEIGPIPQVSVIIATHNRSTLLQTAVESVLAQTYPAIEIIIVDDGSTDDTAAVVAKYAGQVTYIRQANQGVSAARNTGFRASSGEYVNFLDDDDTFLPTKIERQVEMLEAQPEVGLVHCGYQHIDEKGTVLNVTGTLPEGSVLKELVSECFLVTLTPLVRRQCLDEVGLFDESLGYSEDWDLWLRIALAGYPFACIQEPLCAYRVHQRSKMSHTLRVERGIRAVLDRVFENPDLPADVLVLRNQIYSGVYFWIGCQHCAAGRWDDAQRSIVKALGLRPELLADPAGFVDALFKGAMDVRIADPVTLLDDFFQYLPPQAECLRPYRSRLVSKAMVALSLRAYAATDITAAKRQLVEAIELYPPLLEQTHDFFDMVCRHALEPLVNAPPEYVDTVFRNLPTGAERLGRLRSRALSEVNVGCAFRDYSAGRHSLAVHGMLRAIQHRPVHLANRGVLSVFLRSLFTLLMRKNSTGCLSSATIAHGT
jgi:glycosyltransferase involved in cell wall biosynthesis